LAGHGGDLTAQATYERIAANLKGFERHEIDPTDRRRAAVALLISPLNGALTYALTRRALTLRRGAGNYALPGGNFEPGEDAIDAAVRESNEELGLTLERSSAIGPMDDFLTLGGHVVTPVVLWSDAPLALDPDPTEVHAAFLEPLSDLDHPEAPLSVANPDGGEPILRMYAQGTWINPPTAAFLYQFREVALHGRATRVHMVGQPNWTAR
jgi:8-oxo-dGTP pyrophosphatase MutT (NUDIX family)